MDRTGDFVVRVTDLALEMQPALLIQCSDGATVGAEAWRPTDATVLFVRFGAKRGDRFTVRVTNARLTAEGGHYRISAGAPLAGEAAETEHIYLPLIWKR